MKIVALGANLPSRFGSPQQTLFAALTEMAKRNVWPVGVSRIWKTAPVPYVDGMPWFYNAVAEVETSKTAHDLLKTLLEIEQDFGRVRTERNAPRLLDLDLISYDNLMIEEGPDILVPHPRMHERAFVLLPLMDIAEEWIHPQNGLTLEQLIKNLPPDQKAEPVEGGWDE
jgi:2-amino-4-hydroxy-6-hydroxymethyldihydropteridine diphosphokinase